MSEALSDSRIAVYRVGVATSWLTVVGLGALVLAAMTAVSAGVGPVGLFGLVLTAAFVGRIYHEILHVANVVATDGVELRGYGMFRRWNWRLSDVATVRRSRTNNGCAVLVNRSGDRLMVRCHQGWSDFVALIGASHTDPAVTRLRWYEKGMFAGPSGLQMAESWPGGPR